MQDGFSMQLRPVDRCRYDIVSLGEVMVRFDPGEERIAQTRSFRVWEGGGEYNVARGLRRVFGKRAAIITALVDNPIGRLAEDLMLQGGVDVSHVVWRAYDGVGQSARNGLYFMERGFGLRNGLAAMDRGHTAVAQLQPGDVDWETLFGRDGVRWFHTGGIFCALSETTPLVAKEAMQAAQRHGTIVSYDCNYRPSLWKDRGGRARAAEVNRELASFVDVLFGHEGDLATELIEASFKAPSHSLESYVAMAERVRQAHPNFRVIATATRTPHTASRNDFGGYAYAGGRCFEAKEQQNLDILDRVGGGDSFGAGFIASLLEERGVEWALNCGVAHGALAMTTPGDNSYATREEVERVMQGGSAGAQR